MLCRHLCIALVFSQVCIQAIAQDAAKSDELRTFRNLVEDEAGDAALPSNAQDLQQLLERILVLRLRNSLQLSDEQLHALSLRVGTFKKRLTAMKFRRGSAREHLRDCLDEGLGEDQINQRLTTLLEQEKAIAKQLHKMILAAGESLTIAQTAELYLFIGDFDVFMSDLIERAQSMHRSGDDSAGLADLRDSKPGALERTLVRRLVELEAAGPTGQSARESDMAALFDGLLMTQLSRALQLTPEETVILFRRVGSYTDQLHEMKWQVGGARAALRSALDRGTPDAEIQEALGDLLLQEEAVADLIGLMVTEAQKDVSLEKSARLYLFVGDFEEYVRRLMNVVEDSRLAPSNP